jgi:hypothetical protein
MLINRNFNPNLNPGLVAEQTLIECNSWYQDNEKSVQHFVVDECHQVSTCNVYQKKFSAVKELAQYPVQNIYLTTTLAPYLEDYFLQQVYLPHSTLIFREPTN